MYFKTGPMYSKRIRTIDDRSLKHIQVAPISKLTYFPSYVECCIHSEGSKDLLPVLAARKRLSATS